MVCFSTYVFSMSQEFVPTCPREQWPHAEQDINQVLYSAIDGGKFHNKDHGGAVPKKTRCMFSCTLQINIKRSRLTRFSSAGYVWTTREKRNFHRYISHFLTERAINHNSQTNHHPSIDCQPIVKFHASKHCARNNIYVSLVLILRRARQKR